MGTRCMKRALVICLGIAAPISAHAEAWNCTLPGVQAGDEIRKWKIRGDNIVGPSLSDLAPSPPITLRIISNTDKALIAFNDNGNRDGFQADMLTIDKVDGKITFRMIDARNVLDEHYEGRCKAAKK